jgi:hypothetical protein
MLLILCEEQDSSALWAAAALRLRGFAPQLVTGMDLSQVVQWQHRVSSNGADWEMRLQDGVCIRSHEITGMLNRLSFIPSAWLRSVGGTDRDYAQQEMQAFYLSWLYAVQCKKLNAPTPQGLCGNWRHPSVWAGLAAKSGLPVKPFRQTSNDDPDLPWQLSVAPSSMTLHVVGEQVFGPDNGLVSTYGNACLHLAKAADVLLLGIDFERNANDQWEMVKVSIMPDLMRGGEAMADALAKALTS